MTNSIPYGVRLEANSMLPWSIEKVIEELSLQFCDVTGFGELEWLELSFGSPKEVKRFEGPLQLVDLKGRLRVAGNIVISDYFCTISRLTDNGIQILAGRLESAKVTSLELTITKLTLGDEESASAETKTKTPRKKTARKNQAVTVSVDSKGSVVKSNAATPIAVGYTNKQNKEELIKERWAEAIEETKNIQNNLADLDLDEKEIRPELGNIINHTQFGKCTVARIDDEHISLRKPNGRIIQLGLEILKFTEIGEEDGKPLFEVKVSLP